MPDIFDILGLFNRPGAALWSGIDAAMNPDDSALQGAWEGLTGVRHKGAADVFGLEAGTPEDDWAAWLAKNALRTGVDVVGDPTTWLGGPIMKALGKTATVGRMGQAVRGSAFAKPFVTGTGDEGLDKLLRIVQREGSIQPIDELAATTKAALEAAMEGKAYKGADVYGALEREAADAKLKDLASIVRPLQEVPEAQRAAMNELLARRGLDPLAAITEEGYSWMPHMQQRGYDNAIDAGRRFGEVALDPKLADPMRDIVKWVGPEGQELFGTMKRVGITPQTTEGGVKFFKGAQEFERKQATIPELLKNLPEGAVPWVEDPVAALHATAKQRQGQLTYLKTMDRLIGDNKIFTSIDDAVEAGFKPNQLRNIGVKGFEDFLVPKPLANVLENLAGVSGPGIMGGFEDVLKKFVNSAPGQTLGEFTNWWKHNILSLFPGYHAGNQMSNAFMMGQSGEVNPLMIPARIVQGRQLAKGTLGEIVPGVDLQKEALLRRLMEGSEYSTIRDSADAALKGPGFLRRKLGDDSTVADIGEGIGKVNQWAARTGQTYIEDPARLGVFVDWAKKNKDRLTSVSEFERATLLDEGAQFAKDALLDYGPMGMTPSMRNMTSIFPFLRWNQGIAVQTAKLAVTRPRALANTEKLLEGMFQPASEQEKALMPDWMAEQGPVHSSTFAKLTGQGDIANPFAFLGRFVPQGNIEQMTKRPLDFLMAMLNPAIKTPFELLTNRNSFKNQPIDPLAGNALSGLLNPLTGDQYALSGNTKFGYEAPATLDYLMSGAVPGSRHLALLNEVGRSLGLWEDPYKQESNPMAGGAWALSGGKVYPLDMDKALKNKQWQAQQDLNKIKGLLKKAQISGDDKGIDLYLRELMEAQLKSRPWLEGSS